ncbi:MAG: beta-ketoacyl-ACP synthase II [Dehalococcoidia bacterium]|nr:beta-ketoacyl-ACP synthase II [Dehalococcoidia bacterium]
MSQRVAVTGVGMVTPLGHDTDSTWQSLVNGKTGTARITAFDPDGFASQVAGEVKNWEPESYLDRKTIRRTDRFVQFAFKAADEALEEAQLEITKENAERIGVLVGTSMGGLVSLSREYDVLKERGPNRVSPFLLPLMLPDMASGQLSIRLGARAANYAIASACSSGADALGEAANLIRRGDADVVLAGGSEATIAPIVVAGFAAAKALTNANNEPDSASRPFDSQRDGFVIAEGAAVLVLESEKHALQRGAKPLAEFAAYAATSDAHHVTQPLDDAAGAANAMELAVHRAGMKPDEIDYINAHGTSTPLNDKAETQAIKRAFGEEVAATIPISSTKSMTGHLLGAAGAVEAGISVSALTHGVIPPTINYRSPDPDCDLDYVPNVARAMAIRTVLSNSFGFGGHNSSLLFRQWDE